MREHIPNGLGLPCVIFRCPGSQKVLRMESDVKDRIDLDYALLALI